MTSTSGPATWPPRVLDEHARNEVVSERSGVEVGTALEAMAGVSMQAMAAGAGANGGGIEPRSLNQDVCGGIGHAGVPASHDPGEPQRFGFIGDDEVVGHEFALAAVQQAQLFPGARTAHHNATLQGVQIEDVGGLAHGEPGEVRHVHRRRDGLLPKAP